MAGPQYLVYDKVTGALTHVSNDVTVVKAFAAAGYAVLDWPSTVYPTMAVVPGNANTGVNVPVLVPVSAANLPVSSTSHTTSAASTASAVISGGTTSA